MQGFRGWRAVPVQNVALAVAPRTLVLRTCKGFQGFLWLTCQKCFFEATQDCKGATITLIHGIEVP
eukprot:2351518-Pyramimonas_sp.AAC.1